MIAAVIFQSPPHGTAGGREGLDAALALSAFARRVDVYFLGDGVYQLKGGQDPAGILSRDHARTFGVLPLYDVGPVHVLARDLVARGLWAEDLILPCRLLEPEELRALLGQAGPKLVF